MKTPGALYQYIRVRCVSTLQDPERNGRPNVSSLRAILVNIMSIHTEYLNPAIGKGISVLHRTKKVLYAAAALHAAGPLLLAVVFVLPLLASTPR